MIDALSEHVLKGVIDLDEICDAKRILETMARERIEQLGSDHPQVQQFWDAFEYMNVSRNASFSLNHHDQDAQSIAINLNEVYKVAARNYQSLPDINEMRNLLRSSRRYKFIDMNKPVKSKNFPADDVKNATSDIRERVVKCWLFTNPYFNQQPKKPK